MTDITETIEEARDTLEQHFEENKLDSLTDEEFKRLINELAKTVRVFEENR